MLDERFACAVLVGLTRLFSPVLVIVYYDLGFDAWVWGLANLIRGKRWGVIDCGLQISDCGLFNEDVAGCAFRDTGSVSHPRRRKAFRMFKID